MAAQEARFRQRCVMPRVAAEPSLRSNLEARLTATRREGEALLLAGLEAMLGASLAYIRRTLTTQKSAAYRPRADQTATLMEAEADLAWETVAAHVAAVNGSACFALQGANLDAFLTVFGSQLYAVTVEHLRRHCGGVATLGAPLLRRDVTLLAAAVGQMRLPRLDALFSDLNALCDLFIIPATSLRALATEGTRLGALPPAVLMDFVRLRADYNSNKALINAQLSVLVQEQY